MEEIKKKIVSSLQGDIPIEKEPFKNIASELGLDEDELLVKLKEMKKEGTLRRVGAILRHREVGFEANAMVAWQVPDSKVDEVGKIMAGFEEASHVYLRPTYPDWPYNLFTMIHSTSKDECEKIINNMSEASGIEEYKYLYSTKEYKKTSMEYFNR
ncbi:hypothetical protein ACONDI_00763 [Natranaerofaba carboxydovora]|nr:Lrp/AsnC family transcriptional regulator [Natranaerofaba carboxydovora]UMZ73210.1 hypothetical protein ACONDI_00763 [Natranaerofaba carboxydovora]